MTGRRASVRRRIAACLAVFALGLALPVSAEYADVVISGQLQGAEQRPVVFPHWFHRIRYRCNVCHVELGIRMRAGGNRITMQDITDGRFCGACHNDRVAWGPDRCDLCHSGKPGLPSGIHGGSETKGPGRW